MSTEKRPPVIVNLNVEWPGGSESDTTEIDRDEWDALTPAQRTKLLEEIGGEHAYNYVGWGWHIEDPTDYAATEA